MQPARLGHGIGLRHAHYHELLDWVERGASHAPGLEWLEAISENFFEPGGRPRRVLRRLREHFPLALHGVSLSLGSVDPLNEAYLVQLQGLVRELEPAWVSDHLCWGGVDGRYGHDLWPLPYSDEALDHVCARVSQVQERLGRPIAIENVSSYLQFAHATMQEWEFLSALVERTGCALLLDVNNVFVSAHNHGFDARAFIAALPATSIAQIHLAGHSTQGALYLDTHDAPVPGDVWALYRFALECHGSIPTSLEWDDQVPPLARVIAESAEAARLAAEVMTSRAGPARAPSPPAASPRVASPASSPATSSPATSSPAASSPAASPPAASSTRAMSSSASAQATRWPRAVPTLAELEREFWRDMQAPPRTHDSAEAAARARPELERWVASDARASATERLELYARMYALRLHDALADDFAKLAAQLGPSAFRALADDYLRACPSRQPSLRHFGRRLPEFLRAHPLARDRPWLAELAALEWARCDVFDRGDEPVLTLDVLQTRAQNGFRGLRLQLVSAHAQIAVEHDVERTWRALHAGEPTSAPTPGARTLLVWRQPDQHVYHRALDPDEAELCAALAAGVAFEDVCERLAAHQTPDLAAARAAQLLARWADAGLLRRAPTDMGPAGSSLFSGTGSQTA